MPSLHHDENHEVLNSIQNIEGISRRYRKAGLIEDQHHMLIIALLGKIEKSYNNICRILDELTEIIKLPVKGIDDEIKQKIIGNDPERKTE